MHLFFDYIKAHYKIVLMFLVFNAVFAILFTLYALPIAAVGYACAICVFIGTVAVFCNFMTFRKKHKLLKNVLSEITVTDNSLPLPRSLLERDYQDIIKMLFSDRLRLMDQMSARYTDLVEYYTLWVHQIKTPIAAMRLILQGESSNSEENRELFEELQKIEQYVEMVLCYLRLDTDSTDYVIKEYDLDEIIKQAVRKYASQFIRRKIALEYEPVRCHVLSDEKWLLFVVEQVLSNALKYTKSGMISITMEPPKILCIRDTGIGISPEDLPRIFEKGFTGYNGRKDKKASGLGLYLCRRICDKLGHKISAVSAVGSGTVVRINLESAKLETE